MDSKSAVSEIFKEKGIRYLYHFTDKSNLKSIVKHKGIHTLEQLRDRKIDVPCPGGNEWSHDADERIGLHKYAHLCFDNYHPMCWKAQKEDRIPHPYWIRVMLPVLDIEGVLFASDVSNKSGVQTHPIRDAIPSIDFDAITNKMDWNNPEEKRRLDAVKRYEVLVPNGVSIKLLKKQR